MFDIGEFHRIAPKWARQLHYHEELVSTNDEARRLAEQGAAHGTVVLADFQTAGRGRRGTVWSSDPGDGLLFSVVLRPDYPRRFWYRLALASGLGVVNALRDEWDIPAEIKWPNDIYIQGKKCAGILVESQDGFVIVGVGLNVFSAPEALESTSLNAHLGVGVTQVPLSREQVLAVLLDGILKESKHCGDGFEQQMERMRQRCWLTGKSVTFRSAKKQLSGRVVGLGDGGDLLVEIDGEVQPFQQAELIRVL